MMVLGLMSLCAASVAFAAARSHGATPRTLKVACARTHGGVLRYVTSTARCRRRSERAVDFAKDAPVYACVRRRAIVRRMDQARRCGRGAPIALPAPVRRSFCVDRRTHLLRGAPCRRRREFKVILAEQQHAATPAPPPPGNHAPTAVVDAASVDEDHATAIAATANDGDADGDAIRVSGLAATGARGAVSIDRDGTIAYDPRGAFESLRTGDTAHDTFAYRAGDGTAESGEATVDVTVTGVNDAPVLNGIESGALPYAAGAGAAAITGSLAISDVDGTTLSWASVQIAAGRSAGHDVLAFTDQLGISGSYDAATGVLTLTGAASPADYEAVLRSVTFATDAAAAGGSRTITFQVDDGGPINHASAVATRAIAVTHVDHAPTAAADTASTDEDSAIASVAVLGNDDDADGDALHVASIDTTDTAGDVTLSDGTISYDPAGRFDELAQGATATDTFRYRAADPGGADSAPATVSVTVTGVDDAPVVAQPDTVLAFGSDQAAAALVPNLTATDVDSANLTGATIRIGSGYVSGKDALSFADTPSISGSWDAATGTLTLNGADTAAGYQAALRAVTFEGDNASGVASASRVVSVQVSDGTLTSAQIFRTIAVTHVDEAPTAVADSYAGAVGNTALAVGTSPSGPHTSVGGNVLANDADPDTPHASLTASASSPTPSGARVTMNADGTFTYVPPAGFTGDDSFQYTLSDSDPGDPRTAAGTVTVTVAGPMTWYVDAAAAPGGDGRSDAPFTTPAPLSTGGAADAGDRAGDRIFVYGSAAPYAAGIVLEPNQKLLGEPQGLTSGATTLVPPHGSNPVIAASGAPAVTLAGGADVERVDLSAGGAPAVSGMGVATATIGTQTAITGSGGGVALDGGSGAVAIGSAITTTGGHSVSVQNRSGGTVSFSGAVTDSGTGIQLRADAGASVLFSGRITAGTGASSAFSAAGGGTVTATGSGSTLASTTGTALDVRGDAIGASGLKFQSVSANGAVRGIVLSGTGSSGGLNVTGTGAANSGGTIRSTSSDAVSLSDTKNASLNDILVQSPQHAGIRAVGVHGFALTNSTITGAGAASSDPSLAFSGDGALTVTSNALSGGYGGGLDVASADGTMTNATVANNTISGAGSAIAFDLSGTAATVASLTQATITSNTITGGIAIQGGNMSSAGAPAGTYGVPSGSTPGAGSYLIDISSNTISAGAISAAVTGRGQGNFSIRNNATGEGIATSAAGDVTVNADVEGNHVDDGGLSVVTDTNVQADASTLANPVMNAEVVSNETPGLSVSARDSSGTTRVRLSGNSVATPGMRIDGGGNATLCAEITANTAPGIVLDKPSPLSTFGLPGLSPDPADASAVASFVAAANPTSAGVSVAQGDQFGDCALPF
jgi:VCBS repeat-containing protein